MNILGLFSFDLRTFGNDFSYSLSLFLESATKISAGLGCRVARIRVPVGWRFTLVFLYLGLFFFKKNRRFFFVYLYMFRYYFIYPLASFFRGIWGKSGGLGGGFLGYSMVVMPKCVV